MPVRWCIIPALWSVLSLGAAHAQQAPEPESSDTADSPGEPQDDDAPIRYDEQTGERYREIRPEGELQRGPISTEAWVVGLLGAGVVLFSIGGLVWAARKR